MSNENIEVKEVMEITNKEYERLRFYARKGKLYNDLIEMFKIRMTVDAGLLDEEVKNLLTDAKNEIIKIRKDMNKLIDENLTIKSYAQTMAKQLYVNFELLKVKDNTKKEKLKSLLLSSDADMKYMDLEKIDNIFNVVLGEQKIDG